MSEQNKIDEIKAEYQMAEELFKRQPQMKSKFDPTHDWIGYLLAEIERKDKALQEIVNTEDLLTGGTAESMRRRAREAL